MAGSFAYSPTLTKIIVARSWLAMVRAADGNLAKADVDSSVYNGLMKLDLDGIFKEINHFDQNELRPVYDRAIEVLSSLNIPYDD